MVTKEQLEEEINDKLDTDFEWSKMKKEELKLLNELIDEGILLEPMAKHIAADKGKDVVEEQIKNWRPGKLLGELQ
jgi:hypothetical protein